MEVFTQTEPLNLKVSMQLFKVSTTPSKVSTTPSEVSTQTDDTTMDYQACSSCEEDFFCPMCQEIEKCILILPTCKHRIHTRCAPPWFGQQKKETCPICREPQPPSFVQNFQIPAAAEQTRMETLRQSVRGIMDAFIADMGNTPLETERRVRSTLSRLDDLSMLIGDGEERTVVQNFRDHLWTMLPSNHNLLTGNELDEVASDPPMSEDDLSSDDEWMPERPVLATEERTVTTRSIVDERTRHVIDNLNFALASDRDHYGIERALRVSLRQLSRVERMEMDRRNRFEIQMLRRNLIDMLPSHQPQTDLRPNELLYLERTMAVQDAPTREEVESEAVPARRTLRQMARNPFIPRDYPVRRVTHRQTAGPRNESVRRRDYENNSDEIQIVDVWSMADRN